MFNLANFIKSNLMSGYQNGSFTKEQVNIFALNYLNKAQISQVDFNEIREFLTIEEESEVPQ
jgi:hypothetical protein